MPRRTLRYGTNGPDRAAGRVSVPGLRHPVEVSFVRRWTAASVEPRPDVVRVIVGPAPPPEHLVPGPGVILCHADLPQPSVRERSGTYTAGDAPERPAAGERPVTVTGATGAAGVRIALQVSLGEPPGEPEAIRRLVAAVAEAVERHASRYADALAAALAVLPNAGRMTPALGLVRRALSDLLAACPPAGDGPLRAVVQRLGALAAAPDTESFVLACRAYPQPADTMEDVSLLRVALVSPAAAADLVLMRGYLERAAVPDGQPDLAIDRTLVVEQLSPDAVLADPHRIHGIRASFEIFRSRYRAAYRVRHQQHAEELGRLRDQLEAVRAEAEALRRLNTLAELGPPAGLHALREYERLTAQVRPCPELAMPEEAPRCLGCDVALDTRPPDTEVRGTGERVLAALTQQLRRLSLDAVKRIVSRGEHDRLERLVRAAQASDLTALARLLDDELLGFLRSLLQERATPDGSVLRRLAAAYPEVREGDVDNAVEAFRDLLYDALDRVPPQDGVRRVRLLPPEHA